MPPGLKYLDISFNEFTGTINVSDFPVTMKEISLESNQFEGGLDLGSLPTDLRSLNLSENCFSRKINLSELPKYLRHLYLSSNAFTGCTVSHPRMTYSSKDYSELDLDLRFLPVQIETFDASCNLFRGNYSSIICRTVLHAF